VEEKEQEKKLPINTTAIKQKSKIKISKNK
jgi:hypothetical protein